MQPWQAAGKAAKKSAQLPFVEMAKAANLLSYALPTGLAVQGLGKLNPTLGKFFDLASKYGFSEEDALNNVKEKLVKSEQTKEKSLFERLLGDVDLSSLDESAQKELKFLAPIAAQLEQKGKDEKDPAVKKLRNKIQKILGGKVGGLEKEAFGKASLDEIAERMAGMVQPQGGQPKMQQPMPDQMGQQQQPQMGPGQAAILAILQKIQATRGAGG